MSSIAIIQSPFGLLQIELVETQLKKLSWVFNVKLSANLDYNQQLVVNEFNQYFKNATYHLQLNILLQGSPFQLRVWQALKEIPIGETLTYGNLAKKLETSARAIGNACRQNPIAIFIPCHRVVGLSSLGGYAGATSGDLFSIKKSLLQHENSIKTQMLNLNSAP